VSDRVAGSDYAAADDPAAHAGPPGERLEQGLSSQLGQVTTWRVRLERLHLDLAQPQPPPNQIVETDARGDDVAACVLEADVDPGLRGGRPRSPRTRMRVISMVGSPFSAGWK
jgi:hypothetical protein